MHFGDAAGTPIVWKRSLLRAVWRVPSVEAPPAVAHCSFPAKALRPTVTGETFGPRAVILQWVHGPAARLGNSLPRYSLLVSPVPVCHSTCVLPCVCIQ